MILVLMMYYILVLFLTLLPEALSIYHYPTDPIPDRPLTNNRTAICISGQLRSGNTTWTSGKLRVNTALKMFGDDDPTTPIETTLEWFMRPLALYGGIDVFMYITAKPEAKNYVWDGSPDTYEPVVNDTFVCTPYTKHPIFQNHTGNRFFCLVEEERELSTPFTHGFNIWKNYTYGGAPNLREQVLQQLYGMYRTNLAAKEYAKANFIDYTYKARLRPDTAFVRPFPKDLLTATGSCRNMVWCPNHIIYGNGWEDSFNFGLAAHMDKALDRYDDLLTMRWDVPLARGNHWDLEDFLVYLLKDKYNICLGHYDDLWLVVIRKFRWGLNTWIQPTNTNQWRQINRV